MAIADLSGEYLGSGRAVGFPNDASPYFIGDYFRSTGRNKGQGLYWRDREISRLPQAVHDAVVATERSRLGGTINALSINGDTSRLHLTKVSPAGNIELDNANTGLFENADLRLGWDAFTPKDQGDTASIDPVSYTHLTLPTKRIV